MDKVKEKTEVITTEDFRNKEICWECTKDRVELCCDNKRLISFIKEDGKLKAASEPLIYLWLVNTKNNRSRLDVEGRKYIYKHLGIDVNKL